MKNIMPRLGEGDLVCLCIFVVQCQGAIWEKYGKKRGLYGFCYALYLLQAVAFFPTPQFA